jgi:hypothetical protein
MYEWASTRHAHLVAHTVTTDPKKGGSMSEDLTIAADRLEEIKDEIHELLREARRLVRGTPEEDRAKAYWLAHLAMSLDDDHEYLGRGGITMQDTIEALRGEEEAQ